MQMTEGIKSSLSFVSYVLQQTALNDHERNQKM